MEKWQSQISEEMQREDKFLKLVSHKGDNVSSKAVQQLVRETITGALANFPNLLPNNAETYCQMIISTKYLTQNMVQETANIL